MDVSDEDQLETPKEFQFPFTPYSIQQDFMQNLYAAIEGKKLGIFESPTGTGKSLSLICGALCWLLDHEARERRNLTDNIDKCTKLLAATDIKTDDWLIQQSKDIQIKQKRTVLQHKLTLVNKFDEKIKQLKSKKTKLEDNKFKQTKVIQKSKEPEGTELEDCYESLEDEDLLLDNVDSTDNDLEREESPQKEESYRNTKIYFCSRTHSQLTQFISEVRRSPYGEEIRLVPLASRSNYCINTQVKRLKNNTLINERCLELQKGRSGKAITRDSDSRSVKKSRTSAGCPFMKQQPIESLKEKILCEVQDVEQLVTAGQQSSGCPYYASRQAVTEAQVVVVPYNTLLHRSTRESSGINLQGNIVIIDEAHNLLETISHIHSSEITGHQLSYAYSQLTQYEKRFSKRFSPINVLRLGQIIFIISKFIQMLGAKPGSDPTTILQNKSSESKIYQLEDFVLSSEIDNINLFNILSFCQKTKLAHKLHGFEERYQPQVIVHEKKKGVKAFLEEIGSKKANEPEELNKDNPLNSTKATSSRNPLMPILSFLDCLNSRCADGRVLYTPGATLGKGCLKYLVLNPASHFQEIVEEARSVIVAGGTMQPLEEFRNQLFISAGGNPEHIVEFACDHVIPPENILPIILTTGPSGKQLDFSYQNRCQPDLLSELGRLLINVCNIVPAGIVCFFPSYEYECLVYSHFTTAGIIAKLEAKKKLFREPKEAGMVDQVLSNFASTIKTAKENSVKFPNGALLFSVVGGKLSEGLNFSDDLGRCVIVVGLPYPNIKSAEIQEKMTYLNKNVSATAGQQYYENSCMKAVNQSVGRSVRHRNDYSTVLLLDQRYARSRTQAALPSWIQKSLQIHNKFGPLMSELFKFFAARRDNST